MVRVEQNARYEHEKYSVAKLSDEEAKEEVKVSVRVFFRIDDLLELLPSELRNIPACSC